MNTINTLVTTLVYLGSFGIAALVIVNFEVGSPSLALAVGAIAGCSVAAMLYHQKNAESAPFIVKATTGGLLAGLALATGFISQLAMGWMEYPDVVLPIATIATAFFPFAFFGPMQKVFADKHAKDKAESDD